MSKVSIIHLSDLHVHNDADKCLIRLNNIAQILRGELQGSSLVLILVSGDIAYSGAKKEYSATLEKFRDFEKQISGSENLTVKWLMAPGNHDGEFKNASRARLFNIEGILKQGEEAIDESIIEICTAPQANYSSFKEELRTIDNSVFSDKLLDIQQFEIGGKKFAFWEMNVSWMSRVPEIQGDLVFPISRYKSKLTEPIDFRFAILHHPLNWYTQASYHPLKESLLKNFCALFSGHEHIKTGYVQKALGDESQLLFMEAGALGPHSASETASFSLVDFEPESGMLKQKTYQLRDDASGFTEDAGLYRTLKVELSPTRDFEPTRETREALEELGAPFSHPTRDALKLSDVYVEPQFKVLSLSDNGSDTIKSSEIYAKLVEPNLFIIRGDEHVGKTSFLNQIFYKSLGAKLIPVRLSSKELAVGTEEKRDRLLQERVAEHFGANAVPAFAAAIYDRKLVLVDDFDKLGTNVEQYKRALQYIKKKFGQAFIAVSEHFDVSILGSSEVSQLLGEYDEYRMLGFSYAMRTELINRWYSLDTSLDRTQLEAKVHEAQGLIDNAVAKALVPSTAFNTLMILQAMEATQKSQVVDAGVAQHYDMLIRRRLADSGAPAKAFDGMYAYLSHLAWWLRGKNVLSLDRNEMDAFNDHFRKAIHNADTAELVRLFTKARILSFSENTYQFRHPSARYFFLAHFIAEHAEEDKAVKEFALSACRRLYRKDNANLIVFLASKVASRWIIREVASVLSELLPQVELFNVVTDAKTLNSWVTKTAKLAISHDLDHEENRQKRREREEEAQATEEQRPDGEEVEHIAQLDTFTQINLVFKTSEILGLILKSKFGSLDAPTKKSLISQLFDGPLKAISFFLGTVNEQPDALIEYLSRGWEDKLPGTSGEQRTKLAQKFVYFSLGAYAQALIQRQGEIIGSPDLSAYIASSIDDTQKKDSHAKNPGKALTYRLVGISAQLSYPGGVPFNEIERLAKELKGNPFGFTLLQGLVANHLYMFPVVYSARQRLAAAVDLDLQSQLAKEVTLQDAKAIPSRRFNQRNPTSLLARLTGAFISRNESLMKSLTKKKESND